MACEQKKYKIYKNIAGGLGSLKGPKSSAVLMLLHAFCYFLEQTNLYTSPSKCLIILHIDST